MSAARPSVGNAAKISASQIGDREIGFGDDHQNVEPGRESPVEVFGRFAGREHDDALLVPMNVPPG